VEGGRKRCALTTGIEPGSGKSKAEVSVGMGWEVWLWRGRRQPRAVQGAGNGVTSAHSRWRARPGTS
jgi:hypothetical protein